MTAEPAATAAAAAWAGYATSIIEVDDEQGGVWRIEPAGDAAVAGTTPAPTHRAPVYVVTAANPGSRRLAASENAVRNDELRAALDDLGVAWADAVGYSADGAWIERSYALAGTNTDAGTALELARRFGQAAIFAWTGDAVEVMTVDGLVASRTPCAVTKIDWQHSTLAVALAPAAPGGTRSQR